MGQDQAGVDSALLERFEREIWSKIPHVGADGKIVNATPLRDLTRDLRECAKSAYGLNLDGADLRVYGKFDSVLPGGSIKSRAALHIIHEAIKTGAVKGDQTVIEATSGNFGIALGLLSRMGMQVVALVSRKLQEGVFKELREEGIRIMDLDMEICPAPGTDSKTADAMAAKATAANVRSQMSGMGFDPGTFDDNLGEIESLLARQDIINLAVFLGRIYGLFCPAQYENRLNIDVHDTVTGAEIDQQLRDAGESLGDGYRIVCAFGTGGTSGGLSKYVSEKYGTKAVHVVFPPAGQDVAGIRTKANADGLKLYDPQAYAAEHEVDYEKAKPLLKFFVDRGHDIGESTALALYEAMRMTDTGGGGTAARFVVIVADGIGKYRKNLERISKGELPIKIGLEDAAAAAGEYSRIVWVHPQYAPKEEGIRIIAESLGVDASKISVPKASYVNQLLSTREIPEGLARELDAENGRTLLVCMAGNTSLMTAQVLAGKGMAVQSLDGGITNLPESMTRSPGEYVQAARE